MASKLNTLKIKYPRDQIAANMTYGFSLRIFPLGTVERKERREEGTEWECNRLYRDWIGYVLENVS